MTTIAYKDGIIAYDSRSCRGEFIESDRTNKRHDFKDHIFFLSGSMADFEGLMAMIVNESTTGCYDAGGLMVDPEGVLWKVGGQDNPWRQRQDLELPTAFGSGTDFAIAAMDFGCTAKEAVKYAMTRDPGTGGKVRTFRLARK